ncbi:oligosaccharide flippase family protein [Vibrio diabolicus]|uniref:oligosaccharide flippase family protein n=1 Tax=Vibrio diabolicus TaxID=50719 RepID=UPI0037525590
MSWLGAIKNSMKKNFYQGLLSNTIFLMLATLIKRGALFIVNIVLIRGMTQEQYGLFSFLRTSISTVEGIASATLGSVMIREVARSEKANIGAYIILNVVISFIVFSIIFILNKFSLDIDNENYVGFETVVYGVLLYLLILLSNILQVVLVGKESFKLVFYSNFLAYILSPIVLLWAFNDLNVNSGIRVLCVFYGLESVIKTIAVSKKFSVNWLPIGKLVLDFLKRVKSSVGLLFFGTLISSYALWFSRANLLDSFQGNIALANFDACFQLLTVIMLVTGVSTSVFLPRISKSCNDDRKKLLKANMVTNSVFVLVVGVFIFYTKSYFLDFLGEGYVNRENESIVDILILTSLFFTLNSCMNKYYISSGREFIILTASIISGAFLSISSFFLTNGSAFNLSVILTSYYIVSFFVYAFFYISREE